MPDIKDWSYLSFCSEYVELELAVDELATAAFEVPVLGVEVCVEVCWGQD